MEGWNDTSPTGLQDLMGEGVRVLFVGFNPSVRAAQLGHHYAGRGNQFWRLLAASGLTPRLLRPEEDRLMLDWGLGSTNLVARPTASAAELTRAELRAGVPHLKELVTRYDIPIIAYTGKGVYLPASGRPWAPWGRQEETLIEGVMDFVLPSPSGLARLPFQNKLAHYGELARLVGQLTP